MNILKNFIQSILSIPWMMNDWLNDWSACRGLPVPHLTSEDLAAYLVGSVLNPSRTHLVLWSNTASVPSCMRLDVLQTRTSQQVQVKYKTKVAGGGRGLGPDWQRISWRRGFNTLLRIGAWGPWKEYALRTPFIEESWALRARFEGNNVSSHFLSQLNFDFLMALQRVSCSWVDTLSTLLIFGE